MSRRSSYKDKRSRRSRSEDGRSDSKEYEKKDKLLQYYASWLVKEQLKRDYELLKLKRNLEYKLKQADNRNKSRSPTRRTVYYKGRRSPSTDSSESSNSRSRNNRREGSLHRRSDSNVDDKRERRRQFRLQQQREINRKILKQKMILNDRLSWGMKFKERRSPSTDSSESSNSRSRNNRRRRSRHRNNRSRSYSSDSSGSDYRRSSRNKKRERSLEDRLRPSTLSHHRDRKRRSSREPSLEIGSEFDRLTRIETAAGTFERRSPERLGRSQERLERSREQSERYRERGYCPCSHGMELILPAPLYYVDQLWDYPRSMMMQPMSESSFVNL